ncbi:MAG: urease accessory protein UreD [Clostridium sp.]|nr:urease accessory protein UreD [Clostridium sp.]
MNESCLKLNLKLKHEKTIIEDSYFKAPLKILKPFYNENNTIMKLCLINVSAGVLEGDQYNIDISMGENTCMYLYSQSYTKVFKMRGGHASWNFNVDMKPGSSLFYMPMPVIPFVDSNFKECTNIRLSDGCSLIFREIISCGRYKNDEIFDFLSFKSKTKIFYKDRLIFMDNTVLKPKEQELRQIGFYEKYDHQANMILFGSKVNANLRKEIQGKLLNFNDIDFGISESFKNGIIIRILGRSSESLRNITDEIYCEIINKFKES